MIDGLMKIVEKHNIKDAQDYAELRAFFSELENIKIPWYIEPNELSTMYAPERLKAKILKTSEDLYSSGWAYLPEVRSALVAFMNESIPNKYEGNSIPEGIELMMFPEQSDLNKRKKIFINNIKYTIAKTSANEIVAARTTFNHDYDEAPNDSIISKFHDILIIHYCNIENGLKLDQSPPPILNRLGNFGGVKTPLRFLGEGVKFEQLKTVSIDYSTILEQL